MSYKDSFISISGAVCIQQASTYWLKTIIKTQYVNGTNIYDTFNNLYYQKEKFRFFRGISPNILKVLVGRNSDILIYKYFDENTKLCKEKKALFSGITSSFFKVGTMPLDTVSNIYQVKGQQAKEIIMKQYKKETNFFFRGPLAYLGISSIGSSAWLYSYEKLKDKKFTNSKDLNNAITGVSSSLISDVVVNPFRIVKTYKQSNENYISYRQIMSNILKNDNNIFKSYFRGYFLRTSMNAFNSGLFVVLWKQFE